MNNLSPAISPVYRPAREDDVEKVDFARDAAPAGFGFAPDGSKAADFEEVLRAHARQAPTGGSAAN
jgi:hypothetical protein